ncbi:MAG TPA: RNA-binding S4 domain-containing protein [Bacteroidales bacterium]|nr:RNA-binding S4 domain-containing protein [Bacteroidales bacterium]
MKSQKTINQVPDFPQQPSDSELGEANLLSMEKENEIRIDKFLWAARIYKTRSIASEECRKGRIIIKDIPVKPSRVIYAGEIITVKKPPVIYTFRVVNPADNRVSAKLAGNLIEDLTPEQEKAKLDMRQNVPGVFREKGTGRPTKKDRRLIDRLNDDFTDSEW